MDRSKQSIDCVYADNGGAEKPVAACVSGKEARLHFYRGHVLIVPSYIGEPLSR
jgi:hypothetical protein